MSSLRDLLRRIQDLKDSIHAFEMGEASGKTERTVKKIVDESGALIKELTAFREKISPIHFGRIGITLGRSDGIAKFFAFSFTSQEKRPLDTLAGSPFFGSGIYAIYYHGKAEQAYLPISRTETPIYVGKADPADPQAETTEEQGKVLHARIRDHANSLVKVNLPLKDFFFRASPIQTGMQSAVEDFMIRLFRPIWNKEVKICYGIGKHGDSATTRANKRSPWDTMHPGRKWAEDTTADQMQRHEIEAKIAEHFKKHPIVRDKEHLFKLLALE